ncbi:MAG TPA: glycosyltransferase family 9 protein [bacterium]|nr:glycosyltransferase family 9 protein [bacterium]
MLIRLKGIGDVILSTPLFRALKKQFPSAKIDLVTKSICEPIVRHNPYLNRVIIYPEKPASFGEMSRFMSRLRGEKYDWVIDLAAEPRSAWLTFFTGAPLRAGYAFRFRQWAFNHRIPKNKVRKYQAEVNLDIIRALGVPDQGNQTEIVLDQDDKAWVEQYFAQSEIKNLKYCVGFNPTGTWPSKRWPAAHWKELIQLMNQELGVKPILLNGPGEEGLINEIRDGSENLSLVKPQTTLSQAGAFVSRLDLLLGNDGTPQHLAQAFGIKSLTLCGPHWGIGWTKPGDVRHRYLQYFLDCGPCDLNVCPFPPKAEPGGHFHQECLVKITPKVVLGALKEMLEA